MIKFGSLSHAQLNIEEIQRKALQLFANETKDFRLLVHLLRTLQHAGEADELALAAELLAEFVRHYWENSYPQNIKLKQRLAGQILKRFETVQDSFAVKPILTCATIFLAPLPFWLNLGMKNAQIYPLKSIH